MHNSLKALSTVTLIGRNVSSADGKKLGTIEELLIDPHTHRIISAVVSPSFGTRSKASMVPWDALALSETDGELYVQNEDADCSANPERLAKVKPTQVVAYTTQVCRHGT